MQTVKPRARQVGGIWLVYSAGHGNFDATLRGATKDWYEMHIRYQTERVTPPRVDAKREAMDRAGEL